MNREELLELIKQEGDQKEWVYKDYMCRISRNRLQALCGYVYLEKEDKFYNVDYDSIQVSVHGGLTYANMEGDYWVIGFDCSHSGDLSPFLMDVQNTYRHSMGIYRDMKYVQRECEFLVDQLEILDPLRRERIRDRKINFILKD